jgi:hypothetical protein
LYFSQTAKKLAKDTIFISFVSMFSGYACSIAEMWGIRHPQVGDDGRGFWRVKLEEAQRLGPFDGFVAAVSVELGIDVLDVRANGAHRDHEFLGDLRGREVGSHKA